MRECGKFKPEIELTWYWKRDKFISESADIPKCNNTFCLDNKILNVLLENQEKCRFFNITNPDGSNNWWWGYAYNLMFQIIDFDWDTDIWLCKVIGYLE